MTSPDLSAESAPLANWQERWKVGTESHHHRASLSLAVTESTFFFFLSFLSSPVDPLSFFHLALLFSFIPLCNFTSFISLRTRCFLPSPCCGVHNVCRPQPARVGLQACVLPSHIHRTAITCLIELLQGPSTMRSARFWNSTMRTQRPLFSRYGYPPLS